MSNKQKSFPRISPNYWWLLRNKAIENPDDTFNVPVIASLLNIKPTSVYSTVLPSLNQFELIDKDGKLSERGRKWIIDSEYKDACVDILESIYPIELLEDIKNPDKNRIAVENWFERKTGANRASVLQMTAAYLLLWNGNPDGATTKKTFRTPVKRRRIIVVSSEKKPESQKLFTPAEEAAASVEPAVTAKRAYTKRQSKMTALEAAPQQEIVQDAKHDVMHDTKPPVNINVQIEISADTSTEQIEAVFSRMGKYLLG